MKYFSPEEWRRIWISYKNTPEQQIGIEILRQHLLEDTRIDQNLLTSESTWYMHYKRSPNPYLR